MMFIDMALIGAGVTLVASLLAVGSKVKKEYDDDKIETQKEYNKTRIEEYEMELKKITLEKEILQLEAQKNRSNNTDIEGMF